MTRYFKNPQTLEELRKQYRDLLKKFHPDNENGSEEITKAINAEYEQLFKVLKNRHESKTDNSTDSGSKKSYDNMKWNFEEDEKLRDILNKVIHFENITITIIGNWIWIDGDTYQYREKLKAIGFIWSKPRKKWHWHNGEYVHKGNSKTDFEILKHKYGSTEVETESRKKLATA